MKQLKEKSYIVVLGVLAVIIAYVVGCSLFNSYESGKYHYSAKVIGISVVFAELLLIFVYKKLQNCSNKVLTITGIIFVALLFGIQIWMVFDLRPIVVSDLANVYAEAVNMVQNNGEITSTGYFSTYSHQIPFLLLLYQLFRMSALVGIHDYVIVGGIFNSFMITLSVILAYLTLNKLKGKSVATFFLVTCLFNPVLYYYVPYFYTDTICIPFVMGGIYLTVLAKEKDMKSHKRYFLYLLLGAVLALGFKLRATVIIIGVAVVIYLFLKEKFGDFIRYTVIIGIGLVISVAGYNLCQNHYIKFDTQAQMYPWSHYVMMGVKGEGTWNVEDWKYTHSFSTKEERVEGNLEEIKNRVAEMGPIGLSKLVKNKIRLTWSSGTHAFTMYMKASNNDSVVYRYMVEHNKVFSYWCQIFQCVMISLLLLGLLAQLKSRQVDIFGLMFIALFGAILFYVIWEVRPRYSVFMILVMNLLMVVGQEAISKLEALEQIKIPLFMKNEKNKTAFLCIKKELKTKIVLIIGALFLILSVFFLGINASKYAVQKQKVYNYSVNQKIAKGDLVSQIVKGDIFTQSFVTGKEFSYVEIKFAKKIQNVTATYKIKIMDNESNVLYEQVISPDDLNKYCYVKLEFEAIKPKSEQVYKVEITSENATEENSLGVSGSAYGKGYHIVKGGNTLFNGKECNGDMAFIVYDIQNKSYFTKWGYIFLTIVLIGGQAVILYLYCKLYVRKDGKNESIGKRNNSYRANSTTGDTA